MAILKANPVMKPIRIVAMRALGTVFSGSVHSSARCMEASRPAYMNAGVASPVRKVTPDGQPVLLSSVAQTYSELRFSERARQVMVMTTKAHRVSNTKRSQYQRM